MVLFSQGCMICSVHCCLSLTIPQFDLFTRGQNSSLFVAAHVAKHPVLAVQFRLLRTVWMLLQPRSETARHANNCYGAWDADDVEALVLERWLSMKQMEDETGQLCKRGVSILPQNRTSLFSRFCGLALVGGWHLWRCELH